MAVEALRAIRTGLKGSNNPRRTTGAARILMGPSK